MMVGWVEEGEVLKVELREKIGEELDSWEIVGNLYFAFCLSPGSILYDNTLLNYYLTWPVLGIHLFLLILIR